MRLMKLKSGPCANTKYIFLEPTAITAMGYEPPPRTPGVPRGSDEPTPPPAHTHLRIGLDVYCVDGLPEQIEALLSQFIKERRVEERLDLLEFKRWLTLKPE